LSASCFCFTRGLVFSSLTVFVGLFCPVFVFFFGWWLVFFFFFGGFLVGCVFTISTFGRTPRPSFFEYLCPSALKGTFCFLKEGSKLRVVFPVLLSLAPLGLEKHLDEVSPLIPFLLMFEFKRNRASSRCGRSKGDAAHVLRAKSPPPSHKNTPVLSPPLISL